METAQTATPEVIAAVSESPVGEVKTLEQPVPVEEKPRILRRAPRPRATTTEATTTGETPPAAEGKPKATVRRIARPKTATAETKADETTTEEKPKATVKRAPRATAKTREVKSEDAAEKPSASTESVDKQGEGNATT